MQLDQLITAKLRAEEAENKAAHVPSGKLSAGQLYKPCLEQVLKIIGVPGKPVSDYALRLFKRGNQVEEWVTGLIDADVLQQEANYRNVVGYIDIIKDGRPVEVKSVKSSQWKWLAKEGARWSHKLQAGLYALAIESDIYEVLYVCADDFRTMSFELQTADISPEIDKIIAEVNSTLKKGVLPVFEARESWQSKPEYAEKYSDYGDWLSLTPQLMLEKLQNQYPNSYEKLLSYKEG